MIFFTKHLDSSNFRASFIHPYRIYTECFLSFFVFLFKQEVRQQPIKCFSVLATYFYPPKKKYNNDAQLDIQWNINHADVSSRGLTSAQEAQAVKAN